MFVYIVYKSNTIYKIKSIYPLKQKMILGLYYNKAVNIQMEKNTPQQPPLP